jgi:hypothetical protein
MELIVVKLYAVDVCLGHVLQGVAGTSRGDVEYAQ